MLNSALLRDEQKKVTFPMLKSTPKHVKMYQCVGILEVRW